MRIARHSILGALRSNWQYTNVKTLTKAEGLSQVVSFYLKKDFLSSGLKINSKDWRNFISTPGKPEDYITPLADKERKSFVGFNMRLSKFKHPKIIKKNRSLSRLGFEESNFIDNTLYTSILRKPYVSPGQGWGTRSSKRLNFLGKQQWRSLKKKVIFSKVGKLGLRGVYKIFNNSSYANEVGQIDNLSDEENTDLSYALTIESFNFKKFGFKVFSTLPLKDEENPNLPLTANISRLRLSSLKTSYANFYCWKTRGCREHRPFIQVSFNNFYKRANFRRLVLL